MTHDVLPPALLLQVGFTLLVFIAVLAVLTDTYARTVLGATLFVTIWQLVSLVGPSLLLATILVGTGLVLRLGLTLLSGFLAGDGMGMQVRARLLDDLFTPGADRDEHEWDD